MGIHQHELQQEKAGLPSMPGGVGAAFPGQLQGCSGYVCRFPRDTHLKCLLEQRFSDCPEH